MMNRMISSKCGRVPVDYSIGYTSEDSAAAADLNNNNGNRRAAKLCCAFVSVSMDHLNAKLEKNGKCEAI